MKTAFSYFAISPAYPDERKPKVVDTGQLQLPNGSRTCEVTKVTDGDTLSVNCSGWKERVRLCGIDAPEVRHGIQLGQPLGEESRNNLQRLVNEGKGRVYIAEMDRDRYNRIVAEVFIDTEGRSRDGSPIQKFLNGEQVMAGLAYEYKQYSSNCLNREAIASAEEEARSQKLGVWARGELKPWDYRRAQRNR
jgi:endonuclease YncB( thermonuclease family)